MSNSTITISDRGTALVALHTEFERLGLERYNLIHDIKLAELKVKRIEQRAQVIHAAMQKIINDSEFVYKEI